ncbi:MAG TPA: M14 family zinc carboxypeptidase [Jiangellaceae bacterium]|nr:M14 family zinc carboxypeptidase [Jiangellaceae bacterium]
MTHRRRRGTWLVAGLLGLTLTVPALVAGTPSTTASATATDDTCDPFGDPALDQGVPTAEDVLDLPLGERDVTVEESDTYLQAVSEASPKVVDGVLGTSVDGQPLRYAVVGQERWVQDNGLDRISRELNRLRDPETRPRVAERIIERNPSVLWVAGNIHGDEESGTDASLQVLYELAARTDCTAETILDDAIVVVLPTQNPDGRTADTRRNSYGFDMNRDWFARTQPETDAKVEMLRRLPPQMFIDAHEMGQDNYFFPPNADPVHHEIGETQLDWIYNDYGEAMQDAFDRFDIPYFNGSAYDLLYMGYGDTVPATAFNAAGMTYEKHNGDPTNVRVREQYTAIWSTLMAAGERDADLLREWRSEHVTAYEQGAEGELEPNQLYYEGDDIENPVPDINVRHYFLRTDDPADAEGVQRLVRRLQRIDVDVYRLEQPLSVPDYTAYGQDPENATLPAGTVWIPMAQGQKHWIQAMLGEDSYVPFPYFYDVTAWSGPLLENVPGGRSGAELDPDAVEMEPQPEPKAPETSDPPQLAVWQISEDSSGTVDSAGWLRWWLDNRVELEFTDVSAGQIAEDALDDVDVLVVPSGSDAAASEALGAQGRAALTSWVDDGGTLVTLKDSSRLASRLGLTSATYAEPTSDVPGSLFRVQVDPSSPLAEGVGEDTYAMYEYDFVWSTPSEASAPVRFPEEGDSDWFVSGFAEGEEQLHGQSAVVDETVGDGRVVLFGFAPNFRAFTGGTARLLHNAIVGPAPDTEAQTRAAAPQQETTNAASERLVISVRPGATERVEELLGERGASFDVVPSDDAVSYRVDLDGQSSDEHPWAQDVAQDAATLGEQVVAIRLP